MDNGPNIGYVNDPSFQAKEAAWRAQRVATNERTQRVIRYLLTLPEQARHDELDRYSGIYGKTAGREVADCVAWHLAGKPAETQRAVEHQVGEKPPKETTE